MMNRRTLLQSLAAATATLLLPPSLEANAEAVRRYWSLDRTMVGDPLYGLIYPPVSRPASRIEAIYDQAARVVTGLPVSVEDWTPAALNPTLWLRFDDRSLIITSSSRLRKRGR